MTLNKLAKILALLTIFLLPLYLVKVDLLFFPSNVSEVLAILTIATTLLSKENSKNIFLLIKKNAFLFSSVVILLLGIVFSFIYNPSTFGAGIIKGWLVLPIVFALCSAILFKNQKRILAIVFFSSVGLVAIISLVYRLLNLVTYDSRLSAFYNSPNFLAMYLAYGSLAGLGLFATTSCARNKGRIFLILGIIFISLYFTFSYSVWISIVFSLITASFFHLNSRKRLFFTLFSIAILVSFLSFQSSSQKFSDAITVSQRSSLSSRLMIWNSSLLMIKNNPFFGIGPGNFQETYLDYQKFFPPYLEWAVPHSHNLFLTWYLYGGILGFLGFLAFLLHSFFLFIRNKKMPSEAFIGLLILSATVAMGIFDTTMFKNDLAYIFWIFLFLFLPEKSEINLV